MNKKFSKNELLEMINSGLTKLNENEIVELINDELKKDNEQVDMDYIDLCYDLLEAKRSSDLYDNYDAPKPKMKKPIKLLLVAAVLTVVLISAFTVSAQINLNIPENIVQLIDGNAEIYNDLENADQTADGYSLLDTDLARKLAEHDISPVTFPEEMIKENCKITHTEFDTTDKINKFASIEFEYKGFKGHLIIYHMTEYLESTGVSSVMNIISGQMLNINGMDVLIFEQKNSCHIEYKNNLTTYHIFLDCDLETAIEFAKSIK